MDKFRNERKNLVPKKRKLQSHTGSTSTSSPSTTKSQEHLLAGEDAASIGRHQK